MSQAVPIEVKGLFPVLDRLLLDLLLGLEPADWQKPTVARHWRVKDVVAHLLDGNLRVLSIQRDRYFGKMPPADPAYPALVAWLNQLNADWVKACQRMSPEVLILLHQVTGPVVSAYYHGLLPWGKAIFPVAWAGEAESYNWMHLAREYTEKWLHQQQIREAVGQPGLMTKEYFGPFIHTFMLGLPPVFRGVAAPVGTTIQVTISPEIGGDWFLEKGDSAWRLMPSPAQEPEATVILDAGDAWKLFSKSWQPEMVKERVKISGNQALAQNVLRLIAVMA